MPSILRRWTYRGEHRANRHSRRVADIKAELDQETVATHGCWEVLGDGTLRTNAKITFNFPTPTAGIATLPALLDDGCGRQSIGYTSWPDGTSHAWCQDHIDTPQQTSLAEGI